MEYEQISALYFRTVGVLYYILEREPTDDEINLAFHNVCTFEAYKTKIVEEMPKNVPHSDTPN